MFYIYADGKSIYQPPDEDLTLISPKLALEMGKAGSFEFSVPPSHRYYSELHQLRTVITVELDDVEIFRGRILSNERDFNNLRKIYCEGDLAYLVDSVQKSEKYVGTIHKLFEKIVAAHNARMEPEKQFQVGQITLEDQKIVLTGQSDTVENHETGDYDYKQIDINSVAADWKTTYDYIQTCIIEPCGGYLRTRRVGNITYLDLVKDYGNTAPQYIEFGVNMLDLTEEVTAEDVFTVLIPLGEENITIASVNGGSDELVDEQAVQTYGRIIKTHVFNSVYKPSTLLENAKQFMKNHVNVPVSFTIKAVDLHLMDPGIQEIYVGDVVHVSSKLHSIVEDLTCTRIEYDLENPANNSYIFGTPRQTLTERYREDIQSTEDSSTGRDDLGIDPDVNEWGDPEYPEYPDPEYPEYPDPEYPDPEYPGGGGYGGGGGGGGGGGAAGAAEKKAKELLDKFFDAWINVDPETAHIDLGAVYRELKDMKTVLENQVGITLDGVSGNINIKALKTLYDDLENVTREQSAIIDVLTSDTDSKIQLLTAWCDKIEGTESAHHAEIILLANELESAIEMKADRVDIQTMRFDVNALVSRVQGTETDLKGAQANISAIFERVDENDKAIAKNEASISLLSNDIESQIRLVTKNIDDKYAALTLKVSNTESSLTAIADQVTITANDTMTLKANTLDLQADIKNIRSLVANNIRTTDLYSKISALPTILTNNVDCNGQLTVGGTATFRGKVALNGLVTLNGAIPLTSSNFLEYIGGFASQSWVNEQLKNLSVSWANISDKPTYFLPAKHRHKFSASQSVANGHTHKVTVNGKDYISGGVSANSSHSISISGYTEYGGGS